MVMARSRAVLASIRLAGYSMMSSRALVTRVTHSSESHSHSPLCHRLERFRFSTKTESALELLLSKDWSADLRNQLEDINPTLTHETVVYMLKKLGSDPQKGSNFFHWACERDGFKASSSLYSMLLRILGDKGLMKEFWLTLRKMKEQGYYLDEETYVSISMAFKKAKLADDLVPLTHFYNRMIEENARDSVVKKVVDVVLGKVWSSEVENELANLEITFCDNMVIRVLKELRSHPERARKFFDWVGNCPGYKHTSVTYNAAARVLARDDSIQEFWSVVEEMKSVGHEMDIDTYIKVSRQFQKSKMVHDAVKLYEFMMDGPFKPSVTDCSLLLRSISATNEPDLDLVFRVAKKYESTGNSLSKAVYDGIHRSLTSVGRFKEAEDIVQTMRSAGHEPDNITYSQLVFGLCKAKRLEEACEILSKMEEHGCSADTQTWTILIQGHFMAGEADRAALLFQKMLEKNVVADAALLEVLIYGFVSNNRIDDAYKLFIEMIDKACLRPWQATFKHLIHKLLGRGKLDEAMDLLRRMKQQNYPPFPEPFIQYISRFGTVDDASEFLKALSVKGYPSASAYIHVFKSFFKEGKHSEAKDLLYKCPHHIRANPEVGKLFGAPRSAV